MIEKIQANEACKENTQHIRSQTRYVFSAKVASQAHKLKIDMMKLSVKDFICADCGKQFMRKENVKRMHRTSVANPQKCMCDYCGKQFMRKNKLRKLV